MKKKITRTDLAKVAKVSPSTISRALNNSKLLPHETVIRIKKKAKEMGLDVSGSAMASEAFFPFRDSIDAAASAGVSAIIEPGGSIRDDEVIQAANEHGISLYFTTVRHFLH